MTTGVSHIASNRQHRLSDQVLANTFKTQVRDITRRTRGISLPQLIEERGHTSLDGAATSASASPRVCSPTWRRGSAEDYARIFGGSGRTGTIASMNCAVVAYQSSMQRWPPVRRPVSGACPDTRRSNKPCATTTSTHSVFPDSMSRSQLNPVEPPWYATRMPGGVGGVALRGVPLSRSTTQLPTRKQMYRTVLLGVTTGVASCSASRDCSTPSLDADLMEPDGDRIAVRH